MLLHIDERDDGELASNIIHDPLFHLTHLSTELPEHLSLPLLYLDCKSDPTITPELMTDQAEYCSDVTTKSFTTGHWLLEEDPEGAWKAIEE